MCFLALGARRSCSYFCFLTASETRSSKHTELTGSPGSAWGVDGYSDAYEVDLLVSFADVGVAWESSLPDDVAR